MPYIRTRHIYAENVKPGNTIITINDTIEIVAESKPYGKGWKLVMENGNVATTHLTTVVAVVEFTIFKDVKASEVLANDLVFIDGVWHHVLSVTESAESKRKLDISLMKLDSANEQFVVSVGHKKQYKVLDA